MIPYITHSCNNKIIKMRKRFVVARGLGGGGVGGKRVAIKGQREESLW